MRSIATGIHRERLSKVADYLSVAVAVALPWSTSAAIILVVVWALALVPTLEWSELRRELATAAGSLPVLLFLLGAIGMLWADASWHARIGGLSGFVRLLAIPLLMAQFHRSGNGHWVFIAFLGSCTVLLAASYVDATLFTFHRNATYVTVAKPGADGILGVPVKSYIVQSLEFAMCVAVLADVVRAKVSARRWKAAIGLSILALAFLADLMFVVTGRTTLVVIPALVVVYGIREWGWKGFVIAGVAVVIASGAAWFGSSLIRERVTAIYSETITYEKTDAETSSGLRIEFWKKSLRFITGAPLIGHGTGSIAQEFATAKEGQTGTRSTAATNPHNQTFAVGIQLGFLGIAVLWAMWAAQLLVFRGGGLVGWIGLVVVTSNVVGSLFNSFIFDFTEGWIYVFGVGVAAGLVRRLRGTTARP
jgi:hypothetical protein